MVQLLYERTFPSSISDHHSPVRLTAAAACGSLLLLSFPLVVTDGREDDATDRLIDQLDRPPEELAVAEAAERDAHAGRTGLRRARQRRREFSDDDDTTREARCVGGVR